MPIQIDGVVLGFINLNSETTDFFTPLHAERLQAFANQAATALQNARLYEQAQELAALEERQRLARDLHDAVSQTLWTATLIADVLPALWAEDPQNGRESLSKLQQLTNGALVEMRTLLLELRPAALAESNLEDLLQQLAASTMSRKKVDIRVQVSGACDPPPEIKVGVYRIAQEALNNVAKHARAGQVWIDLQCAADALTLTIRDNGRGFQPDRVSPEHLGLGIMRERALAIGAPLEISSAPEHGTTVSVTIPLLPAGGAKAGEA